MWRSSLALAASCVFAGSVFAADLEVNPVTKRLDLISGSAECVAITGSADLCDGSDAGGSGDAVTVNGSSATDANFADTPTIGWTLNTSTSPDTISGIVVAGSIGTSHIGTDGVGADELNATDVEAELEAALDIAGDVASTGMASTVVQANAVALTTDTTGNYVEDVTCSETMSGCVAAGEDTNQLVGVKGSTLTQAHLNTTGAPTAGQVLSYDGPATGKFAWTTSSGSSPWQTTSNVTELVTSTDTVTVGSATALGKLSVDGDADEHQLLVQNHSTQTNNGVVFENSSAGDLFALSNLGNAVVSGSLTVGGIAQSTITEGLVVNNGSGTDEDDDFTVNVSGGAYEVDAGAATFTSTADDTGWRVVDGTDNTACTSQCTSAACFGFNLAAGATAPVLVGPADATADICLCMGAS